MLVFLYLRNDKENFLTVLNYQSLLHGPASLLLMLLLLLLFCFAFFSAVTRRFWPHLAFIQRPVFLIILQQI